MLRNKLLLICLASGLSVNLVRAEQQIQDSNGILGLWASERIIPPCAQGALTIDGRKSDWHASISGLGAAVERRKGALKFVLPNGAGEFRGRIVDEKKISGRWIQPANDVYNNEYATPVELTRVNGRLWRGEVSPLEERLSLFMSIQRAQDGSITAVIRNPEFNLFRRNVYHVDVRGNAVTFTDTKNPNEKFGSTLVVFNQDKKALVQVQLPNIQRPTGFRHCLIEELIGFTPQKDSEDLYVYVKPEEHDDGWPTASLSEAGLNEKAISELIERISRVDPLDIPFNVHSLLIARHGKLVLEYYFYYSYHEQRPHDMRSASKTFAPLLVGIARDRGAKIDIDTPVYSQFPEYKDFANPDPRKSKITVRDLMTMTSGLACDDNDDSSPGNEDKMQQQKTQPDWYKYTLDLPMARDPGGEQAIYCSAGINLLGGIVRNATHKWLPEFFYENVAKPLQMKTYYWNLMPSGDGYAGGGIYMRPRDQLKLGQLYLNGGVWNGQRVGSAKIGWKDRHHGSRVSARLWALITIMVTAGIFTISKLAVAAIALSQLVETAVKL